MGIFSRFKTAQKIPRGARRSMLATVKYILPSWLRGDYTLRNSELIFSAVSRTSNALATMPIKLYQKNSLLRNNIADMVGLGPNPNMTAFQLVQTMEACRGTSGNCYALKTIGHDEQILRIDPLDPARVKPVMEENTRELFFRVTPEGGPEYLIHNYYILHIPFISTNGYTGVNPVSVLFNTLSYNDCIQQFSVDQLNKGINATIVVEAPANLSGEQQDKAIEDLQRVHKDSGGNLLFLESGLQAKALNLSPVDSQLFEVEKIARSRVAMVYGIPPHMLGDYSDTSFTSQEHEMLEFLSLTMLPIVTAYEQEFTKKLLTPDQRKRGQAFRFNMDALLRADSATTADVNQKAIRGGWKTPNEVRAERGYEPKREGNKLLASRDLTVLEFIVDNPGVTYGTQGGAGSDGNAE